MANILYVKKVVITTGKGKTLKTIRVYLDKKVAKNTKQYKWLDDNGFRLYSELLEDGTRRWYYGVESDSDKLYKALTAKIAKPEEPKKPELSEAEKAELAKKLMKAKKSDLVALLVEAGLA